MLTTLRHFGFNDSFISWVKTLYAEIQTCVSNNGWISEIFKNSRGIRQGCPLSALLFVLSVEIMALRLRSNNDIKGIQVKIDEKTHSIKISQLADDTTLFLSSKHEISLALNEIEIFGSLSGLILNRDKTIGMWIGKLKHCKDKIEGIKWEDKPIKALGMYFGHDKEECNKLNWEAKIEQIKSLILSWEKRNISMIGKILIIKSLILPKFTFLATSGIVPQKYKKEIESCCFKFIWKNKIDKVKRTTLINTYEKGGLNMIDFESYFNSLKASWVNRLTDTYYENWKVIPEKYFNIVGKNWLVFKMNIDDIKNVPNVEHIPEFYRDVIISWVKSGGGQTKTPKRFQDIRKQVIWGNKFIKFGTKC